MPRSGILAQHRGIDGRAILARLDSFSGSEGREALEHGRPGVTLAA